MNSTNFLSRLLTIIILMTFACVGIAQPTISTFSPASGTPGTTVTITGTNFSTTPSNNIVYFGNAPATVSTASATQLEVIVPEGATYHPISVLTNSLIAYSKTPFLLTFDGNDIDNRSLEEQTNLNTSVNSPNSVAIADIDGDGANDILVTSLSNDELSVFRNTSSGGVLSFDAKKDFDTNFGPTALVVGDFDLDGKLDVAVANTQNGANGWISIFRNTSTSGTINFAAAVEYSIGASAIPLDVSIADIDLDGKPELLACGSSSMYIFPNTSPSPGTISFTRVDFFIAAFSSPRSLSVADFDDDDLVDIAVTVSSGSTVAIFRNASTGSGSFVMDTKQDFTVGSQPYGVVAGDFDLDGKPDLFTANIGSLDLSFLQNTTTTAGSISFATKADITSSFQTLSVNISDINGDGVIDVLAERSIEVIENATTIPGSLDLNNGVVMSFDGSTGSVASGDLDGDGIPDLVAANSTNNEVTVFKNVNYKEDQIISNFNPSDKVYGDAPFTLTANSNSSNEITFNSSNPGILSVQNDEATISGSGTITIIASQAEDENYFEATSEADITIDKATLTVTANDQVITYGDSEPSYTYFYDGFVYSETADVIDTEPSGVSVTTSIDNAGSYPIAVIEDGFDENYNFIYKDGNLTVNKAPLIAKADNKEFVYGDNEPVLTISYDGFVNNDLEGDITPPFASVSTDGSVGTYDIILSGGSAINYELSLENGILTIFKANLNITADDKTIVEGDPIPPLTLSYMGFVNDDTKSDIIPPSITTTATGTSIAGEYDILLTGGSADNYELILTNGLLTIQEETTLNIKSIEDETIFPNPASEWFSLLEDNSLYKIHLFSSEGKLMKSFAKSESNIYSTSDIRAGMYYLILETKNGDLRSARLRIIE